MPEAFYTLAPCCSVAGFRSSRPEERRTDSFRHVSTFVVPGSRNCQSGTPVRFLHMSGVCPFRICPLLSWKVEHFPLVWTKAADRYLHSGKERRYWEDRWLKGFGLSRDSLTQAVENRRGHPFGRFIYPGI